MMNLTSLVWLVFLPVTAMFQGQTGFDKTLSKAMARAQTEQRQLMLYFTSSTCDDCKTLDAYFEQQNVNDALDAKYVSARVDIDAFDGQACGQIYGISDVPAVVVVKPDGTITARKQGNVGTEDIESLILHGFIPTAQASDKASTSSVENKTSKGDSETYALQVGYFSSEQNAENLKTKIESRGFSDTWVNPEERDNKTYYRVLVGEYASAEYARTDMKTLKKSGFSVKVHKYTP